MQSPAQFTTSPSERLAPRELDDSLRRPLTDRATHRTPTARVLAGLTKGLALGASPSAIRFSAKRIVGSSDPALSAVLDSDRSWSALVLRARKFVAGQTTPDSGVSPARLAVARRLVGHLLAPAPREDVWVAAGKKDVVAGHAKDVGERILGTRPIVSAKAQQSARACLAVIAVQSLSDGRDFDSSIASMAWLAMQLNLSEGNARKATRNLERLGWISRLNATSQGAARWRLRPLSRDKDQIAWDHADTITAVAAGSYEDDALAAVLMSVTHPAWAYSEGVGTAGWLATTSGLAAVRPEDLGLGVDRARNLRRRVADALPELTTASLIPQLDELAENTLAVFVKADRELAHDELVAARQQERDEFAARRKAERIDEKYCEREIVRPALKVLNGFPMGDWTRETINKWMAPDSARSWIGAFGYFRGPGRIHDGSLVPVVRKKLNWLMTHAGVETETAAWITDQLVPATS